ncbi:MAG: hypothetical protein ACRDXE_08275, partial [Acidimicrobiales bacterium]
MRRLKLLRAGAIVGALSTGGCLTLVAAGGSHVAAAQMSYDRLNSIQKRLVSGLLAQELGPNPSSSAAISPAARPQASQPNAVAGCSQRRGQDVQVNQDCLNISD